MIEKLAAGVTFVFFLLVISYYVLIVIRKKTRKIEKKFKVLSVIVPAHNEERYIGDCIESIIAAEWKGKKEIIVVDDGSIDRTCEITKRYEKKKEIILIKNNHNGKSHSINKALKIAKGDAIAIVDADSVISRDSLVNMAKDLGTKNTGGVTCVIKVKNRKKFVCMWVHIEQLYNSLMRSLFCKIDANVSTPGPLSMFRREALDEINGFSTDGFSEDVDIAIRMIRKGYKIGFCEKAFSETNMPYEPKWFFMQRFRFARGMLKIFKKHLSLTKTMIDIYTLPILVFTYLQALIMGSFTIYQIVSGYITYFFAKGVVFNLQVLKFLFEWFSIVGFIKWVISLLNGSTPLTIIAMVGVVSTMLTYPLYLYTVIKYDRKVDIWHIIPLFFMFPFWLMIMVVYIACIPEIFRKKQYNKWKKYD